MSFSRRIRAARRLPGVMRILNKSRTGEPLDEKDLELMREITEEFYQLPPEEQARAEEQAKQLIKEIYGKDIQGTT